MTMAQSVREFLQRRGVGFRLIPHEYTTTSTYTAETAHVPGDQLAKSVLLTDEHGYLLAVLPSTHHVDLGTLRRDLGRPGLRFASEQEAATVFNDCEYGAIPPLGEAYGLEVVMDDCISPYTDVYFEAGDHMELVHTSGSDFRRLMSHAQHRHFSHHF